VDTFDKASKLKIAYEDLEQANFKKTASDKIARRVSNDSDTPLYVEVVNNDSMICEKGVFNLIANIPLTIMANNIEDICDATFYQDDGKKIFISYTKTTLTTIEVCTKKTIANLEYRLEGPRACP